MDRVERRAHYERSRQTLPTPSQSRWYQHPFIMFVVPFIALLLLPGLYNTVVSSEHAVRPYDEDQLQEIASLMDDIFTTMANMTFIPATAIKRGPHKINKTAIPCKRNAAVMRMMEIMPFVDAVEVDPKEARETDWLYGGSFIDYRDPVQLYWNCNPIRADDTWFHLQPHTVSLTDWGTGGWNNDRTLVILYDTRLNALRAYDGEGWYSVPDATNLKEIEDFIAMFDGVDIWHPASYSPTTIPSTAEGNWHEWFRAPDFLRSILHAYQTLAWIPWETSNKEDGWGVEIKVIKDLLQKNGWPENFDPDQFNVDFIRAKHKGPRRGHAETAYQTVTEILAEPEHDFLPGPTLNSYLNHIQKDEVQAAKTWNKADRDLHTFRAQRIRWDLRNVERRLAKAQKELEALCPTGTCVEEGDQVLWDLLKLQTEYEFWETTTPELECKIDLYDWKDRVPQDHLRHHNCIRKRRREYDWFAQAIEQTREEALAHCTKTGCSLLPIPTLEELVDKRIEELEDDIVRLNGESKLFEDYIQKFSPTSLDKVGQAWAEFERWHSGVVNGPHYAREQIDYLRSELREGGDRNRLRRHIDTANRW